MAMVEDLTQLIAARLGKHVEIDEMFAEWTPGGVQLP